MYRLKSGDKVIGTFAAITFVTRSSTSGCLVECDKGMADGVVAGGKVYAITNSDSFAEYEHVALFELDGEVERSAEIDYLKVMANLI